jgi:hypothetical protein
MTSKNLTGFVGIRSGGIVAASRTNSPIRAKAASVSRIAVGARTAGGSCYYATINDDDRSPENDVPSDPPTLDAVVERNGAAEGICACTTEDIARDDDGHLTGDPNLDAVAKCGPRHSRRGLKLTVDAHCSCRR